MRFSKNEIIKGKNPVSTMHRYKNKAMTKAKVISYNTDFCMRVEVLEHVNPVMVGRTLTVCPQYFERCE